MRALTMVKLQQRRWPSEFGNRRPNGVACCALRLLAAAALALLLSGCHLPQWAKNGFKVGPNYCPPYANVVDNWIDSDDPRVLNQPPQHADWWSVFQDPALNELVEIAYDQNLTLREAGLRIMEARAQRAMVAGNLFPQTQQLSGDFTRRQISIVQQPFLLPIPGFFSRHFDAWSLAGNISWELDIWGRFRRAIESADASLDASIQEYDAILVCLIAEVVTAYIDIRTFEQRLIYARRNIQIQERSLQLTETQYEEGKTGEIGVYLSTSNLDGTKASVPSLEIGLRQANNRLCTLLGIPTIDLTAILGEGDGIPTAPAEVAVGIPADLLRRRPDVRAAERQVAAQSAQIGVAVADLYPSIAITGEISTQAEEFGNLFSSLSNGGSVGPGFRWNVLNYGRIKNNVRFQDARFRELIASYQQTVLTANQEVEDALVAFLQNQERVRALADSAQATQRALELELLNFKEGETDFTGVFVLQSDLAVKQDQLATAQGDIVTSLVSLYKALGGGWQIRCPHFQPSEIITPNPSGDNVERLPPPKVDSSQPRSTMDLPVPNNLEASDSDAEN
jgi:NodT family efflux transporter outer membrane factor (OMF) lipoprotein